MPSGSITIVSWPACTSKGTRFRNPYAEPNSPGISTTGSPSPAITTCSDSAGLSGTLKLRDVSATSASSSSGATALSSGSGALNLSLFSCGPATPPLLPDLDAARAAVQSQAVSPPSFQEPQHHNRMEDAPMIGNVSAARRRRVCRVARSLTLVLWALLGTAARGGAQVAGPTGSVAGRVTDERRAAVARAQITLGQGGKGAVSGADGSYLIDAVSAGAPTVRVRLIGYRSQTASVTVSGGQRATHDFTLATDPLNLEAVVVTGTETPRTKLETSNATTVLSGADLTRAAPRSATEVLRYVPGFTRVESSGGEVNENMRMRGILGSENIMFLETGMPGFPRMHTFFMNADNLFRVDQNIERIEVVRGAGSALFGSNTPGAIINLINHAGGPEVDGSMMAYGGTGGLGGYDFNVNGPIGADWRFNAGGFYRYNRGARYPGRESGG